MYKPIEFNVKNTSLALYWAQKTGRIPSLTANKDEIDKLFKYKLEDPTVKIYVRAMASDDKQRLKNEIFTCKWGWIYKEHEQEYARIVKTMFEVSADKNWLVFTQVPGIHDVTVKMGGDAGADRLKYTQYPAHDVFWRLVAILKNGFRGSKACNVAVLGNAPELHFSKFEYNHPDYFTESKISEVEGDRYRIKIWTGFSPNFASSTRSIGWEKCDPMLGTVRLAPQENIEPFIVLKAGLEKNQLEARKSFYKKIFEKEELACPKFMSRAGYVPI